jgi:hypothetical protein
MIDQLPTVFCLERNKRALAQINLAKARKHLFYLADPVLKHGAIYRVSVKTDNKTENHPVAASPRESFCISFPDVSRLATFIGPLRGENRKNHPVFA